MRGCVQYESYFECCKNGYGSFSKHSNWNNGEQETTLRVSHELSIIFKVSSARPKSFN